jgi:phenylpropionate dioxygenase-like ring-hydroxylating dioxygenase large terminal subunit
MSCVEETAKNLVAPYLLNCWYQAAWSDELDNAPVARTLLNTPILIFRKGGNACAILDRCPHRFAPLSAGKFKDGAIECGYHGLAFDGTGRCVRNPHGPITSAMRTRSFPTAERHKGIWVWFGDEAKADDGLIPDLSYIDQMPDDRRVLMHMPTLANYQLLTDNIMDLSHADYLHSKSLGGVITGSKARQYEVGNALVAEWINLSCDAPGVWQPKVPSPSKADYYLDVKWEAPAVMTLSNTVVPAGQQPADEDCARALHNMTPETATSTHYFVCSVRPVELPQASYVAILEQAFMGEDKPMLEAQQRRMGDAEFWSLRPILLKVDAAAVKVRRRLDAMIAAEHAAAARGVAPAETAPVEADSAS